MATRRPSGCMAWGAAVSTALGGLLAVGAVVGTLVVLRWLLHVSETSPDDGLGVGMAWLVVLGYGGPLAAIGLMLGAVLLVLGRGLGLAWGARPPEPAQEREDAR